MNVFEDLVVELQQENLLEKTFIESDMEDISHLDVTEIPNRTYDNEVESDGADAHLVTELAPSFDDKSDAPDHSIHETETANAESPVEFAVEEVQPPSKRPRTGREFFKKRAMAEVSSLQMVEHVVTGVEREYMKLVPKTFDDFRAKTALHTFLQIDDEINSEAHAASEFALMQETEAWCSKLAERDRHIAVPNLRQYCERSRPALSSHALLALGRFYRNLPYSETVRSKFDFVITRLFSRAVEQEKRICLFTRDETLAHINTLYSDWSSIPLYAVDDDDSKVILTALSFDDLANEAEKSASFDQLIESDFFGRLRMFKEGISELFYAPQVTAAAIDCNIRIGNAYVMLIDRERRKMDANSVRLKYGDINDLAISEATGQTIQLVDLLKEFSENTEEETTAYRNLEYEFDEKPKAEVSVESTSPEKEKRGLPPFLARVMQNALTVNKWFLAIAILLIGTSIAIYVWANYFVSDDKITTAGVQVVDIDNTRLKDYIKTARISGDIFYGQMLPVWDAMPREKQKEVMQVIYTAAYEKGCKQVTLINKDSKTVGYMSSTHFDIMAP